MSILRSLAKKEFLDFYYLRNQYYLYFEGDYCFYLRTLINADDNNLLLYWSLTT